MTLQFTASSYTCLELFPTQQKPHATVRLTLFPAADSGATSAAAPISALLPRSDIHGVRADACVWQLHLAVLPNAHYVLDTQGCEIGFAYLSGGQAEAEQGIAVLCAYGACVAGADAAPHTIEDNPYREQVHFTPPVGWLNDPNGLCFHGGLYHMYYQFYPHAQQWGNMHWGHATSTDLVHWLHRPVFLTPQQSLLTDSTHMGGAFSGSAVHDGNALRFFLTRHIAPLTCEGAMIETQTTLHSADGFAKSDEVTVIAQREAAHSYHFRDPKVFVLGDTQYMVLGSCVNGVPSVLLYAAKSWTQWQPLETVLSVDDSAQQQGCESIECPDLFPLNGTWVCLCAHMNRTDADGRKSPVHYAIGAWHGGALQAEHEGLLDFGGNFYAVQTFEHAQRRIAIGWVTDFYNEHRTISGGVCGSMTLPRVLRVDKGRLLQTPAKEVYQLLGEVLFAGTCGDASRCRNGCLPTCDVAHTDANSPQPCSCSCPCLPIEGNCYYAKITLNTATAFQCILARDKNDTLSLVWDGASAMLLSSRLPTRQFSVRCSPLTCVEIFFDRRTAEVFLNEGEAVGVKTFYCDELHGQLCFHTQGTAEILVRQLSLTATKLHQRRSD